MAREKYWNWGKATRSHAEPALRCAFSAPICAKIIVIKAGVINIPVTPTLPARTTGQQAHGLCILFCSIHLLEARAPACNIHYQLFTFHVYGKADSVMYDTYNNTGLYPMGEVKDCFFNFPASCHPRRGEAHFATATKQCLRIPLCAAKLSIWDASS